MELAKKMNLACVLLFPLLVASFCQLCSAWPWEETASSTTSSSVSSTSSAWFWDDITDNREPTPSLETTTTASSFGATSSWDWAMWAWEQESSTSSFSSSSISSAEEDWYPTPTSTVSEASSSVPSIETLFMYIYEALEQDHLGRKRKRREVEEPGLSEKRDEAARGNKINPFRKRKQQA